MTKACVFCGAKPQGKTKEHIIPQWLIKYTGDPKRLIQLGERKIAFDQMTFPACDKCNSQYSDLEEKAKIALIKIFNNQELDEDNIIVLLDWFDKVRIGLWLLCLKMANFFTELTEDIEPKFYISTRIRKSDRLLKITKINNNRKGINFVGTTSPHFLNTPSCFGLIINNYQFTNISMQFLFNQNLGFPNVKDLSFDENFNVVASKISKATGRMKSPLISNELENKGVTIFQPIIPATLYKYMSKDQQGKMLMKPYEKGVGKLIIFNKTYSFFKKRVLELHVDKASITPYDDMVVFNNQIYKMQEKILTQTIESLKKSRGLPSETKQYMEAFLTATDITQKQLNEAISKETLNSSVNDVLNNFIENEVSTDTTRDHENLKSLAEYVVRKYRGEDVSLGFEIQKDKI